MRFSIAYDLLQLRTVVSSSWHNPLVRRLRIFKILNLGATERVGRRDFPKARDLRFLARAIPSAPESSDERPIVRDDVIFKLEALDRKRERHKIYEGTWNGLPECGSVERDREYFGLELNGP